MKKWLVYIVGSPPTVETVVATDVYHGDNSIRFDRNGKTVAYYSLHNVIKYVPGGALEQWEKV